MFRLVFITGGVVLIGPATYGWGALVGAAGTTTWFVATDRQEGGLRVLLALPLLYFGAIDMVLNLQFALASCHAMAAGLAAALTFIGASVLSLTNKYPVGRFVSHAAVYVYALPLGLGGSINARDPFQIGSVVVVLVLALLWAVRFGHPLMVDVILPITSLCVVAGLKPRGSWLLALVAAGWALVLGLLSLVVRGELDDAPTRAPGDVEGAPSRGLEALAKLARTRLGFRGALGGAPSARRRRAALWLLASFLFLNGPAAKVAAVPVVVVAVVLIGAELVAADLNWERETKNIGGEALLAVLLLLGTYLLVVNLPGGNDLFEPEHQTYVWPVKSNATGFCAVVSLVALPLALILWYCGEQIQAQVVAYLWTVPFGLAAAVPTKGWLGPAATLATGVIAVLVFKHPAVAAALVPPVALVSGAVLADFANLIGEYRPYWHVFAAGGALLAALELGLLARTVDDNSALRLSAFKSAAMGLAYFFAGAVGVSAVAILIVVDWHAKFKDENHRNDGNVVLICFGPF